MPPRKTKPGISDFTSGKPHEMPLAELVNALQAWSTPLIKDWYAYKASESEAPRIAAAWHEATARELSSISAG